MWCDFERLRNPKRKKKRNEESPECSLNICGWYLSLSFWGDCAQHRLATRTDSQPIRSLTQKRLTSRAGVGLACRSYPRSGLRRWFLCVCFDQIAASAWLRGARHFVQNWAELLVRCLCWSRLEWIGCKTPRSDNWHTTDRKQKKNQTNSSPGSTSKLRRSSWKSGI